MKQEQLNTIKKQLDVLKELQNQYGGRTLDNIIIDIESAIKEAEKHIV